MQIEDEYEKRFEAEVVKKYGRADAPVCYVLFPLTIGGPELYTDARRNEIYQRCLEGNKPWQEYADIAKEVRAWYKAYLKGIRDGEVY